MRDDLVKRLRSMHWCVTTETNGVGVSDRKVALEAADRISALQAQNLRLSGMCYDLTAERDVSNELGKALEEDAGQLRAERDRLRKALNQSRLAFAGYVSVQSAIDLIDRAALDPDRLREGVQP